MARRAAPASAAAGAAPGRVRRRQIKGASAKGASAKGRRGGAAARTPPRRSLLSRAVRAVGWLLLRLARWGLRLAAVAVVLAVVLVGLTRWVDPPGGYYLLSERMRLGVVDHRPLPLEDLGVGVARAAVAAEDARFCSHGGVDWAAVRDALDDYAQTGRLRGASTITQQTAKNVFLWHGRTMVRKGMEIPFAALMEWFWGKRRILEVYLNVAEFGEGVFGVEAAARHYYNLPAAGLSERQAARLMALLPSPKTRDPRALSSGLRKRAGRIAAGARTIAARGDDACFAATS